VKSIKRYRKIGLLPLAAGVALFIYLIDKTGVSTIVANIQLFGANFLFLLLTSGARQYFRTLAWHYCIEREHRRIGFLDLLSLRLAAETITYLTFAGPFFGETAKAYIASKRIPTAYSLSSIVVENLIYSLSVALFIMSGALILLLRFATAQQLRVAGIIISIAVLLPALLAYLFISRRWMLLRQAS